MFNDLKLLLREILQTVAGVIHRESKGLHGNFASLQPHRLSTLFRIKVSLRNSASEISNLFVTSCFVFAG